MICIQEIIFCAGTKDFEEALNAVKFLGWIKQFGLAQNIFGPVKGQGISAYCPNIYTVILGQKLRKCVLMN